MTEPLDMERLGTINTGWLSQLTSWPDIEPEDAYFAGFEAGERFTAQGSRPAAPDLLAAFEAQARLTAYYNGHPNGDERDPNEPYGPIWQRYLCKEARAAIAKAEGRQP